MQRRLANCARALLPNFVLLALTACAAGDRTGPGTGGPDDPIVATLRWSDASTWGGAVPSAGAAVTIPAGKAVLLDVSPPALGSLTIEGALVFADTDLDLTAGWILVHGHLQVGTAAAPYTRRAVITLTGSPDGASVNGMGNKVLGVMPGGTIDLHGEPRMGWARLDGSISAGATQLVLDQAPPWRARDRLVIASTDFDWQRDEEVEVASVSGRTVALAAPLLFDHYGALQRIANRTVDERAEVGLLSRNITVRGDSAGSAGGLGGHIMVLRGGVARIQGVELYLMGQKQAVARYPMHWHMAGDVGGQYFANNSVWRSFNRCVTIHGTNNARVEGNVCYDHRGHGYFLEDGAETGNRLIGNLGLGTRRPVAGEEILPSDTKPATYWITNPDNTVRGNVAAGSQGFGFWFAFPERPTGMSAGSPLLPRTTRLREFANNVAHSNTHGALMVDNGPRPDGSTETTVYAPREDPANASPAVRADFTGLTAWKHPGRAVWLRGDSLRLSNAILADNAIGVTFAARATDVVGSLFVGQTANVGVPLATGTPLRGFEFYDGTVGADQVTFVNYTGSGDIPSSAIGYLRSNAFPLTPDNWLGQVAFTNSNSVYVENPRDAFDGDKAAVFLDASGSATGLPGHYVVANLAFLLAPICTRRSEWNAYVCPGPYAQLSVANEGGGLAAPLTLTRDDAAAVSLVGVPPTQTYAAMSVRTQRTYAVAWGTTQPTHLRLSIRHSTTGEWAGLAVPYASATFTAIRDYNPSKPLLAAASRAELDASTGDKYWYDSNAKVLHLKLQVQPTRNWATVEVKP